ncbi:MAG: putative bifunctional polymerase, partial [Bacteroidetes bacterium]|nr:putative bifunctional polymerase [Bacteroidota bacterium]
ISEKELIKKCKNELSQIQNIEWDELISPSTSMGRADLLISDTSSVRFDFAFLYEKPVITLAIDAGEMPGYERDYLSTIWTDKSSREIGFVVERASIGQLSKYIEKAFIEFDPSKICQIRNQTIHHFGDSGTFIAKHFAEQQKKNK